MVQVNKDQAMYYAPRRLRLVLTAAILVLAALTVHDIIISHARQQSETRHRIRDESDRDPDMLRIPGRPLVVREFSPDAETGVTNDIEWVKTFPDRQGDNAITQSTLRKALEHRQWEEVCRMIDELQSQGELINPDVTHDLLLLLELDSTRTDATSALQRLRDSDSIRIVALHASSPTASPAGRVAAIDVLANSVQTSTVPCLERIVNDHAADTMIWRHAVEAIARIGGDAAIASMARTLVQHSRDSYGDTLASALTQNVPVSDPNVMALQNAVRHGNQQQVETILNSMASRGQLVSHGLATSLERSAVLSKSGR